MDIQRVNPGQAGATGIPVRVSRTNEEVILNAQGDALSRHARSVGQMQKALSGLGTAAEAVGKAGAAIYMYDAALNEAKAGHEQKLATANFNTDMQLTNALFGRKLDALSAKMRGYYDEKDDSFNALLKTNIDSVLSETLKEAQDGKGVGFRNFDFFKSRIESELKNGLSAKFMSDQWKARAEYATKKAIGKAVTVLEGLADCGVTDRAEYSQSGYKNGLTNYLTLEEFEKTVDLMQKKGAAVAFSASNAKFLDEASDRFRGVFTQEVMNGADFDVAKEQALSEAMLLYAKAVKSNPDGAEILGDDFVEAESEKGKLRLAKFADGFKKMSNEARFRNLYEAVVGDAEVSAENFRLVSLLVKPIAPNGDSSEGVSWLIGELGGELGLGAVVLANELKTDIALLDLKDSADAKLLEKYLEVARSLGQKEFYEIKTLVQDKLALGGKKSAEKDEIREFVSGVFGKALNKLRGDDAEDALACIDACTGIPRNQWRVVVDATRENANVRRANRDGKSNLYKLLTGSAGSKLTVMNMLKEYGDYHSAALNEVESKISEAEKQGR